LSRPLAGRLADKRGFDFVVIPGIVLIIIAMILLYFADHLAWFLLAGLVYGAGFGTVQPSLQALAVLLSPPEKRGSANATFFTGFDLGIGLGSILWGVIAGATGYGMIFMLCVIPASLALISYIVQDRHFSSRRNQPHPNTK
jgi:predicted MFS family arabinose efflux permease